MIVWGKKKKKKEKKQLWFCCIYFVYLPCWIGGEVLCVWCRGASTKVNLLHTVFCRGGILPCRSAFDIFVFPFSAATSGQLRWMESCLWRTQCEKTVAVTVDEPQAHQQVSKGLFLQCKVIQKKTVYFLLLHFFSTKNKMCFFSSTVEGGAIRWAAKTLKIEENETMCFFIIWLKQLSVSIPSLSPASPFFQSFLTARLFYSSLCSPASFLLLTCAKIRGRTWGFIDSWSCEMTSLVSDLPVYIWLAASCLWSQRKGDNKRQKAPIFPRLEETVSRYFGSAACTGIYTLNLLRPQHTIV